MPLSTPKASLSGQDQSNLIRTTSVSSLCELASKA